MPLALDFIFGYVRFLFQFYREIWWIILPAMLACIYWDRWVYTQRVMYIENLKWVMLEIRMPRNVIKSARAMEEVCMSLHGVFVKGKWWKRYVQGYIPAYYVFEMVAHNGELRFYARALVQYKHFFESRIFSQYPEAEITEVEDYALRFPPVIPNQEYDLWGTEFLLSKHSCYCLRTYEVWERGDPEERIDPLSVLSEGAAKLGNDEWVIVQLYAMPIGPDDDVFGLAWAKQGQKIVDERMGRPKPTAEPSIIEDLAEFTLNLILAPIRGIEHKTPEKPKEAPPSLAQYLSPGEREDILAMEKKLSKLGYWCGARAVYIAKRETYQQNAGHNIPLLYGFFKLFNTQSLNGFKDDPVVRTAVTFPFPEKREFMRKRNIFYNLIMRYHPADRNLFILTTDELATMYHPVLSVVPPPGIPRVEVRKAPVTPEIPTIEF